MGIAALLGFASKCPTMDGIKIDLSVNESHRMRAEVTDSPIETGGVVSDHRRVLPEEVGLEGILSNLPTTLSDKLTLSQTANERYKELRSLFLSADAWTLVTGFQTYKNMVFTSFVVDVNESTGEIVRFAATMRQLEFAESAFVKPSTADQGIASPTSNVGPKAPKPAPPPVADTSRTFLKNVLGFAGGGDKVLNDGKRAIGFLGL